MTDYNILAWDTFESLAMMKDKSEINREWWNKIWVPIKKEIGTFVLSTFDRKMLALKNLAKQNGVWNEADLKFAEKWNRRLEPILELFNKYSFSSRAKGKLSDVTQETFVKSVLGSMICVLELCEQNFERNWESYDIAKEFVITFASILRQYYCEYKEIEEALQKQLWPAWEGRLYDGTPWVEGVPSDRFALCISLSRGFDFVKTRYDAISASIVTQEIFRLYHFDGTFNGRFNGWTFEPKMEEVIGMSPSDAVSRVCVAGEFPCIHAMFNNLPYFE